LIAHRSRSTSTGVQAYSAAVETTTVSGDSEMAKDTAGKVCQVCHACLLTGRRLLALVSLHCLQRWCFLLDRCHIHVVPSDIDMLTNHLSTCSRLSARQPLLGRPRNLWKSRQSQSILLVLGKSASRQYRNFASCHAFPTIDQAELVLVLQIHSTALCHTDAFTLSGEGMP